MSYVLTRIRRALADPPEEPMTHAVLMALSAHWKSLLDGNFGNLQKNAELERRFNEMHKQSQVTHDLEEKRITAELALWEAKRAAFKIEATIGGVPDVPGPLQSSDWGVNWILFDWTAPVGGGEPWGYRIERSSDNRTFYSVEMTVDTEVTLWNQPQNKKFYFRVVAFNGWGDSPPSPVFGVKFDERLVERRKVKARK